MAKPTVPQDNPQADAARYNMYVAAAITGILAGNPITKPSVVAAIANEVAKQAVFEQARVMQIATYNYTNLY